MIYINVLGARHVLSTGRGGKRPIESKVLSAYGTTTRGGRLFIADLGLNHYYWSQSQTLPLVSYPQPYPNININSTY